MRTKTIDKPSGDDWLDEIRRERRRKQARKTGYRNSLTPEQLYGWGLIAGLSYHEMRDELTPGFIMDMYMARVNHDKIFSAVGLFGGASE